MSTEFAFEDFFTEDNNNDMTIIVVAVISHTTLSAHESAVCTGRYLCILCRKYCVSMMYDGAVARCLMGPDNVKLTHTKHL